MAEKGTRFGVALFYAGHICVQKIRESADAKITIQHYTTLTDEKKYF